MPVERIRCDMMKLTKTKLLARYKGGKAFELDEFVVPQSPLTFRRVAFLSTESMKSR